MNVLPAVPAIARWLIAAVILTAVQQLAKIAPSVRLIVGSARQLVRQTAVMAIARVAAAQLMTRIVRLAAAAVI